MRTKSTRVRIKDVKSGLVLYRSHPKYGVQRIVVTSKPFIVKGIGLFAKCRSEYKYEDKFSLNDAGVTPGESKNYRRSFRKLHQAEAWAKKMRVDPDFILSQARHEDRMHTKYHFDIPINRGFGTLVAVS